MRNSPYREVTCSLPANPQRCDQDVNRPQRAKGSINPDGSVSGPWWHQWGLPPPEIMVIFFLLCTIPCCLCAIDHAERSGRRATKGAQLP